MGKVTLLALMEEGKEERLLSLIRRLGGRLRGFLPPRYVHISFANALPGLQPFLRETDNYLVILKSDGDCLLKEDYLILQERIFFVLLPRERRGREGEILLRIASFLEGRLKQLSRL